MKSLKVLLAVLVSAPAVAVVPGLARAATLTYPTPMTYFPVCTTADQEFCIEKFEFTPTNGTKQDLTAFSDRGDPQTAGTNPFVQVFISQNYSGPTGQPQQGGLFPALSVNYMYMPGITWNTPARPKTLDGIPDGAYRTVLRTGDYDPSYMFLTGKYDGYTVTKGSDGYFTVDISNKPAPTASVVELDGSTAALDACIAGKWVTNCESNSAYRRYILVSLMMSADASQRELLRGSWISTNASTFSLGRIDFASGVVDVNAQSPHYVPTDFNIPGLKTENGRELNPAFFEMNLPLTAAAKMLSELAKQEVTPAQAKEALADPTKIFEGTIEELAPGATVATEKAQQLTMTVSDAGVRINFNLDHYSAPNPTLKVKSSSALQTLTVLLKSSSAPTTAAPASDTTATTVPKAGESTYTTAPGAVLTGGTGVAAGPVATITKRGTKAVIKVTMAKAGTIKIYRKLKGKITLVKTLKAKKGSNTILVVFTKGAIFIIRSSTGKVIATLT